MSGKLNAHLTGRPKLDKVFYRLFLLAYFKQNAGLLMFLFILFFNSFFYINYLGKMPAEESFFWHFILVITMVRNQFMIMLFMTLAGFFNLKSLLFVRTTLRQPTTNFIFLSFVVLPKRLQFAAWIRLQLKLNVPLFIYAVFCVVIAANYGRIIYGIVIIVYLILLVLLVAFYHYRTTMAYRVGMQRFNLPVWHSNSQWKLRLLMLDFLFKKQPVGILITKTISLLLLFCMNLWMGRTGFTWQIWSLAILVIAAAHAVLIYKSSRFISGSFPVPGNLPMTWQAAFLFPFWSYSLFLLPEVLLLFLMAPGGYFIFGFTMMLSFLWIYHHLSWHLNFNLKQLLKVVFLLLCIYYLLTLYQLFWAIPVLNFAVALKLFYSRFHLKEERFF